MQDLSRKSLKALRAVKRAGMTPDIEDDMANRKEDRRPILPQRYEAEQQDEAPALS